MTCVEQFRSKIREINNQRIEAEKKQKKELLLEEKKRRDLYKQLELRALALYNKKERLLRNILEEVNRTFVGGDGKIESNCSLLHEGHLDTQKMENGQVYPVVTAWLSWGKWTDYDASYGNFLSLRIDEKQLLTIPQPDNVPAEIQTSFDLNDANSEKLLWNSLFKILADPGYCSWCLIDHSQDQY
jgi:hypothetical protein